MGLWQRSTAPWDGYSERGFWDTGASGRGAATDLRDTRAAARGRVSESSEKLLVLVLLVVHGGSRQPGTWPFVGKDVLQPGGADG